MIVLLEPICCGWVHEEVNAGMLKLVDECTDDKIIYIGEKEQVRCISKLYKSHKICYQYYTDLIEGTEVDCYKSIFYYYKLIENIIVKRRPTEIIILGAYRPCILAAVIQAKIHRRKKFIVVLHGMVEENKGKSNSYRNLFRLSETCNNLSFLTFSPHCSNKYWGLDNNKIMFIHHPYIKADVKRNGCRLHKKKIIGIIGACANPKAKTLIAQMNAMHLEFPYEFYIMSRFGDKFRGIENVKVIGLSSERLEMEKQMQDMDCILLLYDKSEYTVSASGVLWDAISNEVFCFMLNSPYFEYYKEYVSGIVVDNLNEMKEKLCEFICNKNVVEKDAISTMNFDEHNYMVMKRLL